VWSFPYEARTTVQVSCTTSANPSRRFVAVRYPSGEARSVATSAAANQRNFVIATRDLTVGTVLVADDLAVASASPKERAFSSTLSNPAALIGLALTRSVRQGESVGRADARSVQIIKRNTSVTAWSSFPGGRVMARVTALQNGKVGEWIEVENPQSGRRLKGLVQSDGTVRISSAQVMTSRVD
jgi:flagella basal body P-ring formation protein FlgA